MTRAASHADGNRAQGRPALPPTGAERALLRLLVAGRRLEDAAPALGLSLLEAEAALAALQARSGASGPTRLLVLAVLRAWV